MLPTPWATSFHIRAMVTADHGVGHHAGQQRLDGGQNGDGDAVGKLVAEQLQGKSGIRKAGRALSMT